MSQIKCLFVLISMTLMSSSYPLKDNEEVLDHKNKVVISRNVFEELFSTTTESEEDTIILSPKIKRPKPNIEQIKLDSQEGHDYDSKEPEENVKCKYYKHGADLDMQNILDLWKVVYFKLPTQITCFEMLIVENAYAEKKRYYEKYGNLSSAVDWNLCNLEIQSTDIFSEASNRKHFLQGTVNNKGIMDNIIIEDLRDYEGKAIPVLFQEVPDQWLVVKDLLLMRDCDSGGIVVYTRASHKPTREDILDALMIFGEDEADGNIDCFNGLR